MLISSFFGATLLFVFLSCNEANKKLSECISIKVSHGPEDMVFDSSKSRIFIASHDRRNFKQAGEISVLDINSNSIQKLLRKNEPKNFILRPHGISLVSKDDKNLIFVISHGESLSSSKGEKIVIYELINNQLIFKKKYIHSQYITSPNSILGFSNGSFYITNDRKNRSSFFELVGIKTKGSLVHYNAISNKWSFIQKKLKFPNGLAFYRNHLFMSLTRDEQILIFELDKKQQVIKKTPKKIKSPTSFDNLKIDNNYLLTTKHPSIIKFLLHSMSNFFNSPSEVYKMNIDEKIWQLVYKNNGEEISAASVALAYKKHIYIGQIFGDFVLRCEK